MSESSSTPFYDPSEPVPRPPSSVGSDESMDTVFSFPTAGSSATSNDLGSIHMASPAPSVSSLTSSLREQSFRQEFGRDVNSYSEVYRLPADEEEISRLDRQHQMFRIVMGQWVTPLPEVLAPEPGQTKAVLDLGCGHGGWIIDIANAFPECSAVGVDLVPVVASQAMPENCRTELDDINLGLEHFYGDFDVVHARLIASGIRDFEGLIDHIARCLRPRGLMILYEFDFRLYHPDKSVLPPWSTTLPAADAPFLCRWFLAVSHAVRQRGGHIDAASMLHTWVLARACFPAADVVYQDYWCPISPFEYRKEWGAVEYPKVVGQMMREDTSIFLRSGRPLLLGSGMNPEEVDALETGAQRELNEALIPIVVRIQCVYARKWATG